MPLPPHHVCTHKADHPSLGISARVLHDNVAAPLHKRDMLYAQGPAMLLTQGLKHVQHMARSCRRYAANMQE
jgi:hypothetical protein